MTVSICSETPTSDLNMMGNLKAMWHKISSIKMLIQSEDEVVDITEHWVICKHEEVQSDPREG